MNKVLDKLPALVEEELEAANMLHTAFHSIHEGHSVLREEVDEAEDNMVDVMIYLKELWELIKRDEAEAARRKAKSIEVHAIQLAAEAIQVAAMARKFQALEPGVW